MANLLDTASGWLAGRLQAAAGTAVTYRRGGDSTAIAAAIKGGRRDEEDLDQVPTANATRAVDWLVAPADLVLDGDVTLPKAGDLIEEVAGGKTYTFEVASAVAGEPPWRYTDERRTLLRIHTNRIKVE